MYLLKILKKLKKNGEFLSAKKGTTKVIKESAIKFFKIVICPFFRVSGEYMIIVCIFDVLTCFSTADYKKLGVDVMRLPWKTVIFITEI